MLGVLITENALFTKMEVAGEDGTNTELRRKTDDGEGGWFDTNFAFALAFAATPKGKAFRPAEVLGVVVGDEVDLAVIGGGMGRMGGGMGRGIQRDDFSGFLAPTRQQIPALQRARATAPDQNHSPPAENF